MDMPGRMDAKADVRVGASSHVFCATMTAAVHSARQLCAVTGTSPPTLTRFTNSSATTLHSTE